MTTLDSVAAISGSSEKDDDDPEETELSIPGILSSEVATDRKSVV